jgi:ribosome maturation factor RimP
MADSEAIATEIGPAIASLDLELYDVEITGTGRVRVMRVLIDRDGGVDLDAITRATEAITPILDASSIEDTLTGSYTLEVSSPGLERPLRRPGHFARAVGSTVSIKLRAGDAPARRIRGVLEAATDDSCDVVLDNGDTEHVTYDDIVQARTVFEWGPQPKTGQPKPGPQKQGKQTREKNVKEVARS